MSTSTGLYAHRERCRAEHVAATEEVMKIIRDKLMREWHERTTQPSVWVD